MTKMAFVRVENAGRSQMATAFANQERTQRGLTDAVNIVTGGLDPHDHVRDDVVAVLEERGIDISDRNPREITAGTVTDAEYAVTMGCSTDDFVPNGWDGTAEMWDLEHPDGDNLDAVRAQRDEIQHRIEDFFDRLELSND